MIMSEYEDGTAGQVEGESYCMKKSFNVRNTEEMNSKMGYHAMSDLANTPKAPTPSRAMKENKQAGPEAANSMKNDRKGKAY